MSKYVTVEEAARMLGVTPDIMRGYIKNGTGPRHGKSPDNALRYLDDDVESWLDYQSRPLSKEEEEDVVK